MLRSYNKKGLVRHKSDKPLIFAGYLLCLEAVLVGLNHLLNHLTADRASLTSGEVAVVAVLVESYSNLVCSLHLELLESCLCFRYKCIVCHNIISVPLRFF